MERGLSTMYLFLVPTIAGMVYLMPTVVENVYQRGAFTAADTALTSEYSIYYIGSVLFYSIQIVIAKGFYTLQKGYYILRIGIISIVLNLIFNSILSKMMGAKGLALSFSLVALIYCGITAIILYRLSGGFNLKKIGMEWLKATIAMIVMLAVLISMSALHDKLNGFVYLFIAIAVGALSYGLALILLRSQTLMNIVPRRLRR
jgi:putative peptidoglycan lipid II flippase